MMLRLITLLLILIFLQGCQSTAGFSSFVERSRLTLASFLKSDRQVDKIPVVKVQTADVKKIQEAEKKPEYDLHVVRSEQPLETFTVEEKSYADEATNFGFPPISSLIPTNYHEPVTIYMPGGQLISTYELHKALTEKKKPIVINALGGETSEAIPGSIWLSGAGAYGRITDATQQQLAQHLDTITGGDKQQALVFYCAGVTCWSSFNASVRAVNLGYRNVHWYRGGLASWYAAGLPTSVTKDDRWLALPGRQASATP
jgi:PQQ-dependent catabolism-associated CXXCW motif protein